MRPDAQAKQLFITFGLDPVQIQNRFFASKKQAAIPIAILSYIELVMWIFQSISLLAIDIFILI